MDNSQPILMLAVGLVVGVVLGRQLKQCATAAHASTKDVLSGLIGLGTKALDVYDDDHEDKR